MANTRYAFKLKGGLGRLLSFVRYYGLLAFLVLSVILAAVAGVTVAIS